MDIYTYDKNFLNNALDKKNKKLIHQFFTLPHNIMNNIFNDCDIHFNDLYKLINIDQLESLFYLYENKNNIDIYKLFLEQLINNEKKWKIWKIKYNKTIVKNIFNKYLDYIFKLIIDNNIEMFQYFIIKIESLVKLLQKKKFKTKKKKQNSSIFSNYQFHNIYPNQHINNIINHIKTTVQKFSIYLLKNKYFKFLNILSESKILSINYDYITTFILLNPLKFNEYISKNMKIRNYYQKNITKLSNIIISNNLNYLIPNDFYQNPINILSTCNEEIILQKINKNILLNIDYYQILKKISPKNKQKFFNIIILLSEKYDFIILKLFMENKQINLNYKQFKFFLDYAKTHNINLDTNIIFNNILFSNNFSIQKLETLLEYNPAKTNFTYIFTIIKNYQNYNWQTKIKYRRLFMFLTENNLIYSPTQQESVIFCKWMNDNQLDSWQGSTISEYKIITKLFSFILKSPYVDTLIEPIMITLKDNEWKDKECPICYQKINKNDHKLICNHYFHKSCLKEYFKNKTFTINENKKKWLDFDCPYCRFKVLEI